MKMLFKIIYATHANGTHHKLALDALQQLSCTDAKAWRRLFLKHCEIFLEGSKAPDKEFKDFTNHVLHPGDEYWGGAPEKARNWYAHLVTALSECKWSEAAYCAGVLSHYYTDPVMPFHTAQSEAENNMHRAVEWSINKSYNALRAEALAAASGPPRRPAIPTGETWVEELVCTSADHAHAYYEKLIAHYDMSVGTVIPEQGLDPVARRFVGELLLYAAAGLSSILSRAIEESSAQPEHVNLTPQTFIATLKIPAKWVLRKIDDAEDRRVVQAMFDELRATGTVEENLPDDDRAVRSAHEKDVAGPRRMKRDKDRGDRIARDVRRREKSTENPNGKALPNTTGKTAPATTLSSLSDARAEPGAREPAPLPQFHALPPHDEREADVTISHRQPTSAMPAPTAASHKPAAPAKPVEAWHTIKPNEPARVDQSRTSRTYLAASDTMADAPSIGEKTAGRLANIGLLTVADLLRADPEQCASELNVRHIKAETIRLWQDQARLVMEIPGLRGTHAQHLTGAGYRSTDAVAGANADDLSAAILRFASTNDGKRLLRDGAAPDVEKIKTWIDNAAQALKAA